MDNGKEVVATFRGQVKTCRGDRQSQWKSGCVKISRLEGGGLSAAMILNVMPSQVYSQSNVPSSGVSVKSNRVVIEDAKGPSMYVRLSGSREVEESRRAICQMMTHEAPKRSKAEVGINAAGSKSFNTPLKSPSSTVVKQSTPAVSWTKIVTPKTGTKSGDCNSSGATSNGLRPGNQLKRHSLEMEEGDIDKLYNDENQDKPTEYTRYRKTSSPSDNKEHVDLNNLKANSFYGKSVLMSPGLHIKSPRSRVRDQAVSSVSRGLYSAMVAIQESPSKGDVDECKELVVAPRPPTKSTATDTDESNSSIVGFENLGNTCFINSPLQCLAYLEPLSLDIQAVVLKYGRQLKTGSVIRLLYLLMKDVRKSSSNVNPERVKLILVRLRKIMDGKFAANTQQDAHELLSEILDRCDEEIKELLKLDGVEDGGCEGADAADNQLEIKTQQQRVPEGPLKSIPNPTTRNFNSYFKNSFQCQTCKNQTVSQEEHDTTMMLALTSHPELHLQDCVDNYFKGCEVEMKCEACQQNEKATITRKIVRRPRCLILNLLRYSTDNMDAKKKMDRVVIPRYISIADFCSDDAKSPSYITPAFLADRIVGANDKSDVPSTGQDMNGLHGPQLDQEGGVSQRQCPSPVKSNTVNGGMVTDDQTVSTSDGFGSLDKTADEDSVFGQSTATSCSTSTALTTTAESFSASLSYESASAEPFHEGINGDCDMKNNTKEEGNSCNNNNSNVDDDQYDDGVVTFRKNHLVQQQSNSDRIKCRGGADMMVDSNGLCLIDETIEEVRSGGGESIRFGNNTANGVHETDDADDFVPVGQVQGAVKIKNMDDGSGEMTGNVKGMPKKSVAWDDEIKSDTKSIYNAESSNDYPSCLTVKVDGHTEVNDNDCSAKDQADLVASIEEEELMDTEDMGTQMIYGRNVHEYSEDELVSLDVGALTEYEILLYAQALSRFQFEKERKEREKEKERLEQQLFENISDDFVYDESFLEETESMLKSTSARSFVDNSQELSTSPSKIDRSKKRDTEERSSTGMGTSMCSVDSSLNDSSGGNQKVPDILEGGDGAGLLCHENLSEDEEIGSLRGLAVSFPTGECGASKDERKKNVKTSSAAELDHFWECAVGGACGVLSDKNQQVSPIISKTDLKKVAEVSSRILSSQKSQSRKVVNNSPNDSSDSDKDIPPFINRPTQTLPHFTKPTIDLCIISPSKNRNLVKTRDYSRLRSPSASPKKRAAKSSSASLFPSPSAGAKKGSASKQLRFSEDHKAEHLWGPCDISPRAHSKREKMENGTPQKPTCVSSMTPEYSQTDKNPKFDNKGIQATSRALIFGGDDEPDSMSYNHGNADNDKDNNRLSWTPFQNGISSASSISLSSSANFNTITTSTPIISKTSATTTSSSCKTNVSLNNPPPSSTSTSTTNQRNKSDSFSNGLEISVGEGNGIDNINSVRTSRECGTTTGAAGIVEKETVFGTEPKQGAHTPVQGGSGRRKINRSLASSFSAAEGKENSAEITCERHARRKRISQIEQGEANCSYRLVGIVNHHGESLFAGHYTCSSYNLHKQRWYMMDDKHTEESSEWTVRKDSATTGYVFFYMDKELFESYARERVRSSKSSSKSAALS